MVTGPDPNPTWEQLARDFQTLAKRTLQLRASWYAYVGRDDKGVWWVAPRDDENALVRAEFALLCAKAVAKLGIQPQAIPTPEEHSPCWSEEARFDVVEESGREEEGWGVTPYGLGVEDLDAVDACTYAWLEHLRKTEIGFRATARGENVVNGKCYATIGGDIKDVLGSSATHCLRAARSEIGSRPIVPSEASVGLGQRKSKVESNAVYKEIDRALGDIAKSKPSTHQEVFRLLDSRKITRPQLDWLATSWVDGFLKNPTLARSWLSKRWAKNGLPLFGQGPKSAE